MQGDNGVVARIKSTGEYIRIQNWFAGDAYKIERFLFEDGTEHTAEQVEAAARAAGVRGGDGDDHLYGPPNTGVAFYGNGGNDYIHGGNGNDILDGGPGIDELQGGPGDDTYLFGLGYDHEHIHDVAGNDTLKFGPGITPDDIEYCLSGSGFTGIVARIKSTGEYVDIPYYDGATNKIERFLFEDGTVHTVEQVDAAARVAGVKGGIQDESLSGSYGDDFLDGGPGDDFLAGRAGDDIYVFNIGSGHDEIYDDDGNDTLRFGPGITPDDVEYYISGRESNGVVARIKSTDEYVRIMYWFDNDAYKIEHFLFEDGTEHTAAQVDAAARAAGVKGSEGDDHLEGPRDVGLTFYGNGGNDEIYGGSSDDTIYGGTGNDILNCGDGNDTLDGGPGDDYFYGGPGDDIYVFNIGSGHDEIYDDDGNDTLRFGPGITPDDVEYNFSYIDEGDGIIVRIKSTGESIRIRYWFSDQSYKIEHFLFEDGTALTAAQVEAAIQVTDIAGSEGDDEICGPSGFGITIFADAGDDQVYCGTADDTVYGGTGSDYIDGWQGNDRLYGEAGEDFVFGSYGDDYLDGGPSDDFLGGEEGNDTYLFGIGSGHDVLFDYAGNDTLKFGPGITPDNVEFYISGMSFDDGEDNGIIVRIKSTGEYVRILGWLSGETYQIEHFLFEDGTELTAAQVDAAARAAGVK